jgi:type IV pilus assembly protein PilY1
MAFNYMGDNRPFDSGNWNGPWRCAAVIDADAGTAPDRNARALTMNGVYYNPNIIYAPPLRADGTSFPPADARLSAVWLDGVAVNRRYSPLPQAATGNHNNSNWSLADAGQRANIIRTGTDRWACGYASNPFTTGGPYYYRLKKHVSLQLDPSGRPANLAALYTAGNWEAVAVPVAQYQNFANWYAYYRTRLHVARTVASRVFGELGETQSNGGFGSTIRVAWQHINNNSFKLHNSAIASELIDTPACANSAGASPGATQQHGARTDPPACFRSAFFNWLFTAGANGGTPLVSATQRAGEFFRRKTGNNLTNPYWQPIGQGGGKELYCRRNYHMMITDGLWNTDSLNRGLVLPAANLRLPDQVSFPNPGTRGVTSIYAPTGTVSGSASLSDIAFHYWASNLRPDLYDPDQGKIVPPYLPDRSLGVVPTQQLSGSRIAAANVNQEIYFNPANDPATWPHMSEYLIGMGVIGTLNASTDTNCMNAQSDACRLRNGDKRWPTPDERRNGIIANVDDTWHAALAGRGQYYAADNADDLVKQLKDILSRIGNSNQGGVLARTNSALLREGTLGFQTLYQSGEWHGSLQTVELDAKGQPGKMVWDAGNRLTAMAPAARQVLTSRFKQDNSFSDGIAFRQLGDLDEEARTTLSTLPPATHAGDTGQGRLDWLRGVRTGESTGVFHTRTQLMGAIINSQPLYVAEATGGYDERWPIGSPETRAAAAGNGYGKFVTDHRARRPMVYVGANDGMLHAVDASQMRSPDDPTKVVPTPGAGLEVFAYVPRTSLARLGPLTSATQYNFMPTVDATPISRDVFFDGGGQQGWRTLLAGALRLGGRGIYALDISNPDAMKEVDARSKVLWEFHAGTPGGARYGLGNAANLGYTYGLPDIGRLAHGRWVVLLPSGYFPDCSKPSRPAPCDIITEAAQPFSSLFVLDAQTGELIREIRTPTNGAIVSHGLGSPALGDMNRDQIDDVAFAGDLVGNLWRFDLTSPDPSQWSASLAFKPEHPAEQPITVMPRLFPDPSTGRFIVVFGTGKYLGAGDTDAAIPVQSLYGIRDTGTTATRSMLQMQSMAETTDSQGQPTRGVTRRPVAPDKAGWYVDLDIKNAGGERVVVTPTALFDSNRVIFVTLIPGDGDPCNGTLDGAYLVLDAATGGAGDGLSYPNVPAWDDPSSPYGTVGGHLKDPPTGGSLPVGVGIGGGELYLPGLVRPNGESIIIDADIWRRRSWRRLQ